MPKPEENKTKVFKDPVYGYILVESCFCRDYIDTEIFQRLRSIEQTSMRCLFPTARHDRFSHSLGTYHLAKIAFEHILNNLLNPEDVKGKSEKEKRKIEKEKRKIKEELMRCRVPFLVAALMHDCAHSPFSHTLEHFYNVDHQANNFLLDQVSDKQFKKDFEDLIISKQGPAPHEVFSAGIFLKHYSKKYLADYGENPLLVVRMITGCFHSNDDSCGAQIENCLIQLINSPGIDVDKIDYVTRDTWASGISNVTIDIDRLLSSLKIGEYEAKKGEKKLRLIFKSSALSVLSSVFEGRNHFHKWVYSHHIVQYYNKVLDLAVRELSKIYSDESDDQQFIKKLFSPAAFVSPKPKKKPSENKNNNIPEVYLPTDGDILYLIKLNKDKIKYSNDLLTRKRALIPVWKTQAEFEKIVDRATERKKIAIQRTVINELKKLSVKEKDIVFVDIRPDSKFIDRNEILVEILGEVGPYKSDKSHQKEDPYLLVFIPAKKAGIKDSLISTLLKKNS